MFLNQVTLIGRLTHDVELRYTQNSQAVGNFSIAVDRDFKNADGSRDTDFFNVVVWGKLAENVTQYAGKGRLVAVSGRLQSRSYQNKEDQTVRVVEVVAEKVRFLDRADNNASAHQADQWEDDPFANEPVNEPAPARQTPQGRTQSNQRQTQGNEQRAAGSRAPVIW